MPPNQPEQESVPHDLFSATPERTPDDPEQSMHAPGARPEQPITESTAQPIMQPSTQSTTQPIMQPGAQPSTQPAMDEFQPREPKWSDADEGSSLGFDAPEAPSESPSELSLPDLPDLEPMSDSEPTNEELTPPREEPAEDQQEVFQPPEKPFDAQPENAPEQTVQPTGVSETGESAEYLPEDKEPVVDEGYVDAREFYDALLNIKEIKKELRDRDASMRSWEELDAKLDKETNNTLTNIDALQEDLIKIDTTLFEG